MVQGHTHQQSQHPDAAACYRKPHCPVGTMNGGQQCCYDENGNETADSPSPDIISPADGMTSDGTCTYNLILVTGHVIVDVIPPKIVQLWNKLNPPRGG